MNWQDRERDMQEELKALEAIAGRKDLGNVTLAAENARAVWRWGWLDGLIADLRYALRVLGRQASFTVVALLSLGLGIGANAAIFSLMDTLLWRQLPVRQPESLVTFELQLLLDFPTISSPIEGDSGRCSSHRRGGSPRPRHRRWPGGRHGGIGFRQLLWRVGSRSGTGADDHAGG